MSCPKSKFLDFSQTKNLLVLTFLHEGAGATSLSWSSSLRTPCSAGGKRKPKRFS